jgi:hypothetical protein
MIAGSLSNRIAGFHQSCRCSPSSGPRRSGVGTGSVFRRYWRWKSRSSGGRPQIDTKLRRRSASSRSSAISNPSAAWAAIASGTARAMPPMSSSPPSATTSVSSGGGSFCCPKSSSSWSFDLSSAHPDLTFRFFTDDGVGNRRVIGLRMAESHFPNACKTHKRQSYLGKEFNALLLAGAGGIELPNGGIKVR